MAGDAVAPRYEPFRVEYVPYHERISSERSSLALEVGQTVVREVVSSLMVGPAVLQGTLSRQPDASVLDTRRMRGVPHTIPTISCRYPSLDVRQRPSRDFFLLDRAVLEDGRLRSRTKVAGRSAVQLLGVFESAHIHDLTPGEYGMFRGGLKLITAAQLVDEVARKRQARRVPRSAEEFALLAGTLAQEILWKVSGKVRVLPSVRIENGAYTLVAGWYVVPGDILERT